jgi:type I restriction enzyme, R subunit
MPENINQNPEQLARDRIDQKLRFAGWVIQNNNQIDFIAGLGIAIREYLT